MKISSILVALVATREATAFAPSLTSSPLTRSIATPVAKPSILPSPFRNDAASAAVISSSTTQLYMGWGPDPIWSTGSIESNIQACPSGSCVSLKVNVEDGTGYIYPGQYVQCRPAGDEDAKPIFLAIASGPSGEPPKPDPPGKKKKAAEADIAAGPETPSPIPATWEFLIKKAENNDWITSAAAGSSFDVSQVMGGGYPIQENVEGFKYDFPTQNILLFATGSGIAPIRSAIESNQLGVGGGSGRTCTLYYGVRTADDMPYVSKFPQWEELGVQVVPVVSQPDIPCESGAVWGGRTGYVQNALEEDGVPIPRNSGALLCGVKGMNEGVKSMLVDSGVFEGRVMFNF
eukprot:CAMPEP_0172309688 /NCGR_PEP_ID=MMETSP1058-20130122/10427_1 /TAXON_ID=83371 /ORGANISM="Detonula confervacea, Strain CCMP 353" /LENGTH=346 /DNA_ID=CAMNT_0013022361 /DNA_START=25 /DNA_END=1065 /DNA_ORIENTATION=-